MGSVATRESTRAAVAAIVGGDHVRDGGETGGTDGAPRPWLTVRPADTDQVQRIVRLANETATASRSFRSAPARPTGTALRRRAWPARYRSTSRGWTGSSASTAATGSRSSSPA